MIVESRPWVVGQSLTHTNGLLYVATGTGSYKAATPEEVVVEVEPIRQEHFYPGDVLPDWMIEEVQVCLVDGTLVDVYDTEQLPDDMNGMVIVDAVTGMPTFNQKPVKLEDQRQTVYGVGDTLPEWMVGKVNVCLLITGEVVELCDDEAIPDNIDGTVIVDALTGVPTYNQGAQKPVPVVKPIVTQLDEPTKEDVESGVCIWRNELDGCLYTVTVEDDGSCTWFSSDKNDTNTFATVIEAPAAGVDDYNNQYSASQDLIVFADDSIMAMAVDTDTFATTSVTAEGNTISTPDGGDTFVCAKQFKGLRDNEDGTFTETFIDQNGVASDGETLPSSSTEVVAGGKIVTLADGSTVFVCEAQSKGVVLNPLTNMNEMVDQNGDPMGVSWYSFAPENRIKNQIVTIDGEVLDGNGVSVPATALQGAAIVSGGLVAVECDPDGNVVTVAVFPVDTTVGVEYEDGTQPDFNSSTNNFVLPNSLGCVDIPSSAFDDMCADSDALNVEAQAWIVDNYTLPTKGATIFTNPVLGGFWIVDADGTFKCMVTPALEKVCTWDQFGGLERAIDVKLVSTAGETQTFHLYYQSGAIVETTISGHSGWTEAPAGSAAPSGVRFNFEDNRAGSVTSKPLVYPPLCEIHGCREKVTFDDLIISINSVMTIRTIANAGVGPLQQTVHSNGNGGLWVDNGDGTWTNSIAVNTGVIPSTFIRIDDCDELNDRIQYVFTDVQDGFSNGQQFTDWMNTLPGFWFYKPKVSYVGKNGTVVKTLDCDGNESTPGIYTEADWQA